jgi:hypothetical protein
MTRIELNDLTTAYFSSIIGKFSQESGVTNILDDNKVYDEISRIENELCDLLFSLIEKKEG